MTPDRAQTARTVFAFECSVVGTVWAKVVNHRTAGKAKFAYWRDVTDAWPSIPYTAIRCRKLGAPVCPEGFLRNAEYRGMPDVRCGQRVSVGKAHGVIVGHNSSANFDVLFDDDSPAYAGQTLNVHPSSITLEP